jgi:hypothetical protein
MTSKLTLLAVRRSEEYRELVMSADGRKFGAMAARCREISVPIVLRTTLSASMKRLPRNEGPLKGM